MAGAMPRVAVHDGASRTRVAATLGACVRALLVALLAAAIPAAAADGTWLTREQKVEDFDTFCRFVAAEYAYFDVKATDWTRACAHYAPQAAAAADRNAFVLTLERALGELYDHHAHLGTNTDRSSRLVPSQTDVVATWRDGRAYVIAVRAGSGAERAGLRPGNEVVAIDGEPVAAAAQRLAPVSLTRDDPAAREWALQVALAGRHERATTSLRIRDDDRERTVDYAHVDPARPTLLAHRVVGSVGYVQIHDSLGTQDLVPAFDVALAAMPDVRALVLDLRDTPRGGISSVARGIMGRFVQEPLPYQRHELVAEFRSTGVRRLWVEYAAPRGTPFTQPVVVLVGRWTGSMGEGLAIGLNALRGAPVLGQPMAHLLGALDETVLPHSRIPVRVPAEKLFHVDGTPREAFVPCVASGAGTDVADGELAAALALAARLGASAREGAVVRTGSRGCPAIASHSP